MTSAPLLSGSLAPENLAPGNLGLIGCGLMGHGIAKNLLRKGHQVAIFDHPGNQPCDDLSDLGATFCKTFAELVQGKNALFIVLPGSPEVEAVLLGEHGLVAHLPPDTLIIDATTAQPERSLIVAAAVKAKGCAYVDAPMTRTPKEAEAGTLNVLIGGADKDVTRAKGFIQAYAENIYWGGGVSAGHRLKLLHNFVSIGQAAIIAEAVATARKGGVDLAVLTEVLASGGAGGVALERMRPYIKNKDSSAFRFAIKNAAKDLDYYTQMAEALDAPSQAAHAVHQILDRAHAQFETAVMPELIDILAKK